MTTSTSCTSDDPAPSPRVRALFAAAAAPVDTTEPLPGEEEALAAFRGSPRHLRRFSMLSPLVSAKGFIASAITTGVLLTGGVGATAAGVLPGGAQETVSTWLRDVGISVPAGERADDNRHSERTSGESADERHSEPTSGEGAEDNRDSEQSRGREANPRGSGQIPADDAEPPSAADHGEQVSETAKNSTAEGADKGKEVAAVASDGRVGPGERGSAGEDHGDPPASPRSSHGTDKASDATHGEKRSSEAADHGKASAHESRSGGSGNRPPDH
jgi:hypothetical protein